jgi:hypothetical protein
VVKREFSRTTAIRPQLTLVLGAPTAAVDREKREVRGVVMLAVDDLLTPDEKLRLAELAVRWALSNRGRGGFQENANRTTQRQRQLRACYRTRRIPSPRGGTSRAERPYSTQGFPDPIMLFKASERSVSTNTCLNRNHLISAFIKSFVWKINLLIRQI